MNPPNFKQKPPVGVFVAATVMLFFFSLSAADSIGFVPNYIDGSESSPPAEDTVALSDLPQLGETSADTKPAPVGVMPQRISIESIGLDLPIQNPSTHDIAALDVLLQKGPARYVDSALLGQTGNVLIFAHSSHLPVVHNQMFKAFNRIPELQAGDSITVTGGGKTFSYSVTSVRRADATEDSISLAPTDGTKLTLVTCDTLTSKSARWILEADFVGEY